MVSRPIFQLYAELDEYEPKIWRRFQVAGNITIARLGYIVMTLFEMRASHLFAVEVPWSENFFRNARKKFPELDEMEAMTDDIPPVWRYELPDPEADDFESPEDVRLQDAAKGILSKGIQHPGDRLNLNYDFGDNWWVSLVLESVTVDPRLSASEFPCVLEGAGFGIIEDCGGVTGLTELRKAFAKKKGESYEEFREWLGVDELDLSAFDLDDMNFRLKKLPRIYKQIYEDRRIPTQRSINLIEREYIR